MASYTTDIVQSLPFSEILVGQELILGLGCPLCVANEQNVKFCFTINIGESAIGGTEIGTFKTTPNNAAVGLLDISTILESYVAADNMATSDSQYKIQGNNGQEVPIHLIDEYSRSKNSVRSLTVSGYTEFTNSSGEIVQTNAVTVMIGYLINGYVKYSDTLKSVFATTYGDGFGFSFSLEDYAIVTGSTGKFLSNSPSIQYARAEDYGTMGFLALSQFPNSSGDIFTPDIAKYKIERFDADGSSLGYEYVDRTDYNGAFSGSVNLAPNMQNRILYIAAFPANLRVDSTFNTALESGALDSYEITLLNSSNAAISETKRVYILCPNLKEYKPIRLTWLNQFGTWDYYTFNQKSVKSISTKGTTYQQLGGSWNSRTYTPYGFKGGKKTFRVNASEKIKINTGYITEEHTDWFEELVNSPEIYMLKDWELPRQQTSVAAPTTERKALSNEVIPVTLTTKTFTKKTVANDKLIQYTFEVEKSRNLRTQSI